MIVVVLTACPVGLRGDLTRWLLEIAPDVFVGHVSARIRDKLWGRIEGQMRTGKAIMVYSARNEQHLAFRVHNAEWIPKDCEGLELMVRPLPGGGSLKHAVDANSSNDSRANRGAGANDEDADAMKKSAEVLSTQHEAMPHGWSNASKYRKARGAGRHGR